MASAGGLRWLERVAGVALGSLATAWWMRGEAVAPARERADAPPIVASEIADVVPAAELPAPARAEPTAHEAPEPTAPAEPTAPPEPPADASAAAPTLPLPRMPGAARLSDAARFDAASSTWILRASYRVHAHVPQVLAFYTKALADQGLAVTDREDPLQPDGTAIAYLHGRNDRVRAQISVRTRGSELEARIGILWRVRG